MGNVAFTRDEAILALDTLYSAGGRRLRPDDEEIIELSRLLNELPVIPNGKKRDFFRSCKGFCDQINGFRLSSSRGMKSPDVGAMFYSVDGEFKSDLNGLHQIGQAIKRNAEFFSEIPFGAESENCDFQEGALLEHLHRFIERRDGRKIVCSDVCEVCKLNLAEIYKTLPNNFNELHLLVPVIDLNINKKYKSADFITVCPNCHAMLHRHRPWLRRENVSEILR